VRVVVQRWRHSSHTHTLPPPRCTDALSMTGVMAQLTRQVSDTDSNMSGAERILEFHSVRVRACVVCVYASQRDVTCHA
jgi:hypothetical protein